MEFSKLLKCSTFHLNDKKNKQYRDFKWCYFQPSGRRRSSRLSSVGSNKQSEQFAACATCYGTDESDDSESSEELLLCTECGVASEWGNHVQSCDFEWSNCLASFALCFWRLV